MHNRNFFLIVRSFDNTANRFLTIASLSHFNTNSPLQALSHSTLCNLLSENIVPITLESSIFYIIAFLDRSESLCPIKSRYNWARKVT